MTGWAIVGTGLGVALTLMSAVWALSVVRRDASLVDRAWGLTIALLGWGYVVVAVAPTVRSFLAAGLATVWGLRLAAYLTWRNWGRGEDWRYREMREGSKGSFAVRSLFTVFWLQAGAAVLVSTPLLAATRAGQPAALGWLDVVGAVVWVFGFTFEAVGDWQLTRFRSDPVNRGRVLDRGLWRYTRHPNYFGDAVMWWGLGLIGLAAGAWWSLVGPVGMTIVLLRITGVTPTERHLVASRGAAYEHYVRCTSSFIPRPPRVQ